MDDAQRINKYDIIPDILYFNMKCMTKVETVLTEFDAT